MSDTYYNGAYSGAEIDAAVAAAFAAAPQSTTYTKNEVDTALSGKANTSDLGAAAAKGFDAMPTSGNTNNAVSSDGVANALVPITAELVELVDSGAKNIFDLLNAASAIGGMAIVINTNGSFTVTSSGSDIRTSYFECTLEKDVEYVLSGCPSGGGGGTYMLDIRTFDSTGSTIPGSGDTGSGSSVFTVPTTGRYKLNIRLGNGYTPPSTGITFFPMICTKSAWDVSHKFVPYCPSIAELYAMIQALQT